MIGSVDKQLETLPLPGIRGSPLQLMAKLPPDLIARIQYTAFCRKNVIQFERTNNTFQCTVRQEALLPTGFPAPEVCGCRFYATVIDEL